MRVGVATHSCKFPRTLANRNDVSGAQHIQEFYSQVVATHVFIPLSLSLSLPWIRNFCFAIWWFLHLYCYDLAIYCLFSQFLTYSSLFFISSKTIEFIHSLFRGKESSSILSSFHSILKINTCSTPKKQNQYLILNVTLSFGV